MKTKSYSGIAIPEYRYNGGGSRGVRCARTLYGLPGAIERHGNRSISRGELTNNRLTPSSQRSMHVAIKVDRARREAHRIASSTPFDAATVAMVRDHGDLAGRRGVGGVHIFFKFPKCPPRAFTASWRPSEFENPVGLRGGVACHSVDGSASQGHCGGRGAKRFTGARPGRARRVCSASGDRVPRYSGSRACGERNYSNRGAAFAGGARVLTVNLAAVRGAAAAGWGDALPLPPANLHGGYARPQAFTVHRTAAPDLGRDPKRCGARGRAAILPPPAAQFAQRRFSSFPTPARRADLHAGPPYHSRCRPPAAPPAGGAFHPSPPPPIFWA